MVTTQTQEARLLDSGELTREDVLRLIPQYEIKPFFCRHHLNREIIIGLIGLRGDGKSGSAASISLVDYMLAGLPVWSNMVVKCDLAIDNTTAQKYGMSGGGVVHFASERLEKQALLKLDDRYRHGCLVIDEINVQYSNVRRAMTHTNVDFNIVVQELRHLETTLIYTVIDEMFIDPQLRSLTDVFIKCEETAFSMDGLMQKKQPGLDFKWIIYPMSGYLVGREGSYYVTKKPLAPVYFHFAVFRGIYDDRQFQRKGIYSTKLKAGQDTAMEAEISAEASLEVEEHFDRWGWLAEKAMQVKDAGIEYLEAWQLWQILGLAERGLTPHMVKSVLPTYGIMRHHQTRFGQWVYKIETYDVDKLESAHTPVRT